jgi:hypothetical protein
MDPAEGVMASGSLFDPGRVPEGIISPEVIEDADAITRRLRARLLARVEIPEPQSAAGVAAMIRAHNQVFVRRCLHLAEAGAQLATTGHVLATLTLARRVFEVVASYNDFARRIEALIDAGNLGETAEFVFRTAFDTYLRARPARDEEGVGLRSASLLALIDGLAASRPGVREEYELLCEHEFPNVYGSWLYFADYDQSAGVVRFFGDDEADPDYFQWMVRAIRLLGLFEEIVTKLEAKLPTLNSAT